MVCKPLSQLKMKFTRKLLYILTTSSPCDHNFCAKQCVCTEKSPKDRKQSKCDNLSLLPQSSVLNNWKSWIEFSSIYLCYTHHAYSCITANLITKFVNLYFMREIVSSLIFMHGSTHGYLEVKLQDTGGDPRGYLWFTLDVWSRVKELYKFPLMRELISSFKALRMVIGFSGPLHH